MLKVVIIGIIFIIIVLVVYYNSQKEGWYPSLTNTTYVNTPSQIGVYPFGSYFPMFGYPTGYSWLNNPYAYPLAVPTNTIRWGQQSGPFGPMLTSVRTPQVLGQWTKAGLGYTENPNDYTVVDVFKMVLAPGRDFYRYTARTKDGQQVPIRFSDYKLKDGDKFQVIGMEGKGDFIFDEADKYTFVYV